MPLAGVGQVGQAALFILVKSDCSALRTFRIYGTTRIPPRREHQHEIRRQRIGIGTVVISAAIRLETPSWHRHSANRSRRYRLCSTKAPALRPPWQHPQY